MELASQFIVRTITVPAGHVTYFCELSHQAIYFFSGPPEETAERAYLSMKDAIRDEVDRREALRPNGHLRQSQLRRMELLQQALREI